MLKTKLFPVIVENSFFVSWLNRNNRINICSITIYPFILCQGKLTDDVLRREIICYVQWKELYFIGFVFLYIAYFLRNVFVLRLGFTCEACRQIPFEKEMYYHKDDKDYLLRREKFSWIDFID